MQQVAIKVAIAGGLPPVLQAALRSAVAAVLICLWQAARGRLRPLLARDGALGLGVASGVLFGAEFVALFAGLARTSAERAVIVLYTAPFFVAAGAHLLVAGERMRARQWLGMVLAFAAVAAVETGAARLGAGGLAGDALVLLAAIFWAATSLLIKATRLARLSAAKIVLYQLIVSVPVLLACSALAGESWVLAGVGRSRGRRSPIRGGGGLHQLSDLVLADGALSGLAHLGLYVSDAGVRGARRRPAARRGGDADDRTRVARRRGRAAADQRAADWGLIRHFPGNLPAEGDRMCAVPCHGPA